MNAIPNATRPVHILLVEEDPDDRLIIHEILSGMEHTQYELYWARNMEQGWEVFEGSSMDVCLIDRKQLYQNDDIELLFRMIDHEYAVAIIILSGNSFAEVESCPEVADFLVWHEIMPSILERAIRYAMKLARLEAELARAMRELEQKKRDEPPKSSQTTKLPTHPTSAARP